ncbi:hypothetical protein F884_01853 [Acinetobacter sp. CIP 102143]|nr:MULTISPECIES: hypothetical protein [unclassified Acinetobacter]ENU87230.1 hypothetical protein F973_00542 [Acinetobacter sp. CIP 102129]ENU89681.1 hypothetical protein F972_01135 [Acinetobacter sp. CIP 102529]ENU82308.1 hypothetical protein F974_02628 [Acinetobacter sp. CIP 102159]ENV06372.1 hypothetical protein F967_01343 [Acinetobacter sp. CIP 102637]ENX64178.1 hypothetical protein F884_01853 [Acinetobacter sp. CIP 102143]
MDAIGTKDFLAITGYTHAILEMDEWIRDKPYFYLIKDHYLVDEAIRVEYIIIQ